MALPVFALGAAGLTVDSLSPDALCPPQEETRRAVAARLGNVELEGTWRATYVLVHRTRGDFVSLNLLDPDGVLRLERQLPVQAGSCATLSGVIALVLERFFLRPEQLTAPEQEAAAPSASSAPPPPTSAPPPETEPAPPATPAASSERDSPASDTAASKPRRSHLGAGLWVTNAWLAPSLRFDRDVSSSLRLGVSAGFDLKNHQANAFEGSAFVRRVPLSLSGAWQTPLSSSVSFAAGVELLGVVEAAQTKYLAESGSGFRVLPGLGTRLGAHFLPGGAAEPFVELTAAWLFGLLAPAFQVREQEVLAPPGLVLGLAFGIRTPF